ncbi:MAG: excinuclease ABC subunit UvrC [Mariprofundaceae bacterium]|nr:excinuclease ABC subunit UvrC [Mariprofundaceae bacterium]
MWIEAPIDLSTLPREPGVYRMLDGERKVLYIGKARNLRKRVSSYFQRRPDSPRTQAMVQLIGDLNFTVTASEAEALILEHNLIKQLKPRYNVLLKDSKSYPYILLSDADYPRLILHRGRREPAGEYFGPFPDAGAVHETLHQMQSLFRIRDCEDAVFRNRSRPCMQHQIGRCSAPCCNIVSTAEYRQQVDDARAFLKGKNDALLHQWEMQMQQAAEALDFEKAGQLRDKIRALRSVLAGSQGGGLPEDADAIALIRHATGVTVCIGVRRGGRNLGTHSIRVDQAVDADDLEILQSFFAGRYRREAPPKNIMLETNAPTAAELEHLLKLIAPKSHVTLQRPQRGARREWLLQVRRSGEQLQATRSTRNQKPAFVALGELLNLSEPPKIIAAVDNAHLGGKQTVAAIVYADWNGADKDHYRRYKLEDVPAGDDYAAMQTVLDRFFCNIIAGEDGKIGEKSLPCPDLMLIDGGRGQLAVALQAAKQVGLADIKLVGVAKGDGRRIGEETIWPGWQEDGQVGIGKPLKPGRHSAALLLIARVRDEAHRFAGAYMRKRKKKSMFTSQLDGISGIGPSKRAALLRHFGGIEGVKKAAREQLAQVEGISGQLAERIFTALHR